MTNAWGTKYVDKYIQKSDNNGCVGYRVFIHRYDLKVSERFETLEKAISFRDECLKLCELKRLENVKKQLNLKPYPFNLIAALDFEIENVIAHFDERLEDVYNQGTLTYREYNVIMKLYKEGLTLEDTGKHFGVSRERIRQIHFKAIAKLRFRYKYFNIGEYENPELIAQKNFAKIQDELFEKWTYESAWDYINGYQEKYPRRVLEETEIEFLDLSVRAYNCLKRANIHTVNQLLTKTEKDVCKLKNMGKKSVKEIKQKLNDLGLSFKQEER